jgi:hypothetical protein
MTEIKEYFVELIKNGDKYDGKFLNNCKDSYTELKDSYPVSQDLSNRNVIKITVEMRDGKKIYKAVKVICNIGKDEKNEQQQKQEQQDNLKSPDTILTSQNEEPYTKEEKDMKQKVISAYLASKENQKQFLSQRPLPELPSENIDKIQEKRSSFLFEKKAISDSILNKSFLKEEDFSTIEDILTSFISEKGENEKNFKDNFENLISLFDNYKELLNKILPEYFDLKQLQTDEVKYEESDILGFLKKIIENYLIGNSTYEDEKMEKLDKVLYVLPYLLQQELNSKIKGGKSRKFRKYKKSRKTNKIKKSRKVIKKEKYIQQLFAVK